MKGIEMYYTIETLLEIKKSISGIARELGIDRKTVRKIKKKLEANKGEIEVPTIERKSYCSPYKEQIKEWLEKGLSARLIHERLQNRYGAKMCYSSVRNYVRKTKGGGEVYVPVQTQAGEEGQVDFGYMGRFKDEKGKRIKIWVFAMVLSYSRYAYYELVKDQSVETFIRCHEKAFRFFGGVPKVIRIDNLKAGVLEVNFYEPVYQKDYHHFLAYYKASGITCRVRRGQDKGKVESGVKFVKNNFLKGLETHCLSEAKYALIDWVNTKNKRCHGTTRRIPKAVFDATEKQSLTPLSKQHYPLYRCEKRKVNEYGHIAYQYNFYSVPYQLAGEEVYAKSDGQLLKIYEKTREVACHPICKESGKYITQDAHKMPCKQHKSTQYYLAKALAIGPDTYHFMLQIQKKQTHTWYRMGAGVIKLASTYTPNVVNAACRRATIYSAFTYQSIKQICEKKLYVLDDSPASALTNASGFSCDLSLYDHLTGVHS